MSAPKTPEHGVTGYLISRTPNGVICHVEGREGARRKFPYRLNHLVLHSPAGLEFGYEGSGPADLARSLLADYLQDPDPAPLLYQEFKRSVIARLRGDGPHWIKAGRIDSWLAAQAAQVAS